VALRRGEAGRGQACRSAIIKLRLSAVAGLWVCGQRACVVHISTGGSHRAVGWRPWRGLERTLGAVTTCRIDGHGVDLNRQVRIDAVPHTVPSTHAGALFHSLRTSSMRGRTHAVGSTGAAACVRALPGSGADLQLLRPRPDLLCGRLCTSRAAPSAVRRWPTLSDQPPRAREPCSACRPLSRAAKERDASGFPTAASG
jgi:hypothetical protein